MNKLEVMEFMVIFNTVRRYWFLRRKRILNVSSDPGFFVFYLAVASFLFQSFFLLEMTLDWCLHACNHGRVELETVSSHLIDGKSTARKELWVTFLCSMFPVCQYTLKMYVPVLNQSLADLLSQVDEHDCCQKAPLVNGAWLWEKETY